MKKPILLLLVGILAFNTIKAQTEVKVAPFALLFGAVAISAEHGLADDWGLELDLFAAGGGFAGYITGKHYFSPRRGLDKFHAGIFVGGVSGDGSAGAGLGFLLGTKWVSRSNVTFEVALGLGRGGGDISVLPYGKLHIGYRFNTRGGS